MIFYHVEEASILLQEVRKIVPPDDFLRRPADKRNLRTYYGRKKLMVILPRLPFSPLRLLKHVSPGRGRHGGAE